MNFRRLTVRMKKVAGNLDRQTARLLSLVTTAVGTNLVTDTPVDTGFARGNWRPSINAPLLSPQSALDPTGGATIAKIAAIGKVARPGDVVIITNNTPYIGSLNAGSSPQAPAGYISSAVSKGLAQGVTLFAGGFKL